MLITFELVRFGSVRLLTFYHNANNFCKIIFITFSFSLYFQYTEYEKEKAIKFQMQEPVTRT